MKKTLLTIILPIALCSLFPWFLSKPAYAEPIPALKAIPAGLPNDVQERLTKRKVELEKELKNFQAAAKVFNDKLAEEQTDAEYDALQARRARYITAAKAFNEEVTEAASALDPGARIIKAMNALAKQLGWSLDKQARLDKALNELGFESDPGLNGRRTWQDVVTRGQAADLVQEASQDGSLGLPGAGKQIDNQDCAIFALANAAGLPYGVVAARATELIRQGEWRSADERANPQKAIERKGLIGGEVVMLAETFGQAQVVPNSGFSKTLKEGRPVLVNVVSGHEVVLTKTFQHGKETWYVMMDSYQGPQRRLFLSAKELNTILRENGVAFRPEPGTIPKLLREGGGQ